jgi:hypothetical protein
MKFIKILGCTAAMCAAVLAFAATAFATVDTSPTGTTYTGTIKLENEGAISFHGAFTTIACNKFVIEEKIEKHGAGVTVGGNVSNVTVSECNFPVTILKKGSFEIHAATSGTEVNGTVTSSLAEVKVTTSVGECNFTTNATDLGTLTGTQATGGAGTLDLNSAVIPRTGGNFLCGSSTTATGSFKTVTPSTTYIDS